MLQIKKLNRPFKKSGKKLPPGQDSIWRKYGVTIVNWGGHVLYVDSKEGKKKKSKSKA